MSENPRPDGTTVVHLVRHGQVDNPNHVLYGRLPGFHLSAEGRVMAKAVADHLAGRDITVLRSSPLDRTLESAEPIAAEFGLDVVVDERLIEPWNCFEGMTFGVGNGALRRPGSHWVYLRNPFRPSWGEPYADIAARMLAAMSDAAEAAQGHEAVCVSHQLAIWVVRRSVQGDRLWHDPRRRECGLSSVTSFTYSDGQIIDVSYAEPGGRTQQPAAGA
jgi:broad specificity phosphatase PhoE